jgi:hypothetical protein
VSRVQILSTLLVNCGLLSDHELKSLATCVAARVQMLAESGSEKPKPDPVIVGPAVEGVQ